MLWFDRLRLSLRRRWDRVDAVFVDSRLVERKVYGGDNPGGFEIWEYMVDVPDDPPVRLSFQEKRFKVRETKKGTIVPVIVNAKRTKAMFDLSDPRIDQEGWVDEQAKRRKERDDARFEANRAAGAPDKRRR
ncbi:hypothetical protein OJ997_27330 [Solirubrobacter phytolaccae]|uniref:Uncharacterized protein n=1 Tax=Solirubrobacter phytolaccae TaxID=1404360 RepID=A0A9X3NDD5_9ACTN|nr:hypothetical protein [Solirubrobacter phytolaccae]MDA0184051.1 hypothetical protein [Solirubrobacter phytolaccae]